MAIDKNIPQVDTQPGADLIEAIASKKLGEKKVEAAQVTQENAKAQPDPNVAATTEVSPKPTPTEQVAEAISPKTEGDKSAEEAFIKVKMGDKEGDARTLSEKQIKDTYKRYSDLNYKHQTEVAPMKPVLDLAQRIASEVGKSGQKISGEDIAQFLTAASTAYMKNPVMGGQRDPTPDSPGIPLGEIEKDMSKWEEENAISLPPKYKEAAGMLQGVMQENSEIKKLLKNVQSHSQGLVEGTQKQVQDASVAQANAMKQMAANNLNQAQSQHGLSDDAEQDFYNFAFGRGYTIEDFIDPALTMQVVGDFKNSQNSPEMERLTAMAKRRQSFTGALGNTPGASGTAPAKASPDDDFINKVAGDFMKKRNIS
jgi:hypothetical protein